MQFAPDLLQRNQALFAKGHREDSGMPQEDERRFDLGVEKEIRWDEMAESCGR